MDYTSSNRAIGDILKWSWVEVKEKRLIKFTWNGSDYAELLVFTRMMYERESRYWASFVVDIPILDNTKFLLCRPTCIYGAINYRLFDLIVEFLGSVLFLKRQYLMSKSVSFSSNLSIFMLFSKVIWIDCASLIGTSFVR